MEKGMKAQLVVGKGTTPIPSIPGLTAELFPDDYTKPELISKRKVPVIAPVVPVDPNASQSSRASLWGLLAVGLVFGLLIAPLLNKRFANKSNSEIVAELSDSINKARLAVSNAVKCIIDLLLRNVTKATQKQE